MVSRLTPLDASFYFLEESTTPMHVGSLAIFSVPHKESHALEYEELLAVVESRLAQVPRYRQKVREIAFGLARPVWVDDPDFDITYHVRRSALPNPGTNSQLHELIGRLTSRPLDKTRPLWEMYVVEGLENNRIAIYTKSHESLVDGNAALEISQVILDSTANQPSRVLDLWMPEREPTDSELVVSAVAELIARPGEGLETLRSAAKDVASSFSKLAETAGSVVSMVRSAAVRTAPSSPLNVEISRNRRFAVSSSKLDDYRRIRAKYNCEVNDVILAVISGALRNWLISRGEPVTASTTIRAMVPMSVYGEGDFPATQFGSEAEPDVSIEASHVSSFLVNLPVGESNPVVRLSQVAHSTESHSHASKLVDAGSLIRLSVFSPPTLHAMGARAASGFSRRMFNILITNVPGPQFPLYFNGAEMVEMYPVPPLVKNQVLTIGLTSYNGMVYYGFNADRDAMSDVDVLTAMIDESLEELREAALQ
ncbi:MAG: WS/DGAT/MGAT family O-acyltransferase [Mycobacteriaceae bacterium]